MSLSSRHSLVGSNSGGNASSGTSLMPVQDQPSPIRKNKFNYSWTQSKDTVTVVLQTGPMENPYVEVYHIAPNKLKAKVQYLANNIICSMHLTGDYKWPPKLKINYETGKVNIIMNKTRSNEWETLGVFDMSLESRNKKDLGNKYTYKLLSKKKLNSIYNYFYFVPNSDYVVHNRPLGNHVLVFNDIGVCRPYNLVPVMDGKHFDSKAYESEGIPLIIKKYDNGVVSKYISELDEKSLVVISTPRGSFLLKSISDRNVFVFFSGGSGITPMLDMIIFLLSRKLYVCRYLKLISFFQREKDVILFHEMTKLEVDSRFHIQFVVSQPGKTWKGRYGLISDPDLVKQEISDALPLADNNVYYMLCGPKLFVTGCKEVLYALNVKPDDIFVFTE